MKKNIFTKSIRILIVTLLLLTIFFQRERSQKIMVLALILWLAIIIGSFLLGPISNLLKKSDKGIHFLKSSSVMEITDHAASVSALIPEPESSRGSLKEPDIEMMLLHIALRITDKMKSAYPLTTWEWKEPPALSRILEGETIRIVVEGMEHFTHADIRFDRYGRIHIEPLIIGCFATSIPDNMDPTEEAESESPAEPPVVDVGIWYELIGQKILDSVITELNANGHTRLSIKENGDIVINRQKKEVVQATLAAFPGSNYWAELISVLEENELTGSIVGNHLQISWI